MCFFKYLEKILWWKCAIKGVYPKLLLYRGIGANMKNSIVIWSTFLICKNLLQHCNVTKGLRNTNSNKKKFMKFYVHKLQMDNHIENSFPSSFQLVVKSRSSY